MWYVRDRGRVMGPLSTEQVLDLRDRGQLQGFHEVSTDRRAWRAVDLVPELSADAPPPVRRVPVAPAPAPTNTRAYKLIVGGVLAVVLVGGLAIGGAVLMRNNRAGGGGDGGAADPAHLPATLIDLTGKDSRAQEEILRASVGLVVTGMHVRHPDGSEQEALACMMVPSGFRPRYQFGNAFDHLLPGKKGFAAGVQVVAEFGTGSGFAVSPAGYVLTNKHVVERAHNFGKADDRTNLERLTRTRLEPRVWVFFGRAAKFPATVVHVSGGYDLAVLKIERTGGPYFPLCSSPPADIPSTLRDLSAVGFPGVDRDAISVKDHLEAVQRQGITVGPVERLLPDRAFEFSQRDGRVTTRASQNRMRPNEQESWILQHTAQVFGGNSGGPLVHKDGLVLGINSWVGNEAVENRNFALTLPQLRAEIDAATNRGVTWRELAK